MTLDVIQPLNVTAASPALTGVLVISKITALVNGLGSATENQEGDVKKKKQFQASHNFIARVACKEKKSNKTINNCHLPLGHYSAMTLDVSHRIGVQLDEIVPLDGVQMLETVHITGDADVFESLFAHIEIDASTELRSALRK